MTRHLILAGAGLVLIAAGGGAHAQTIAGLKPYALPAKVPAMSLMRDGALMSKADIAVPVLYANAPAQLPRGIARTSVEHRAAANGPVASAGVLCGLKPSVDYSGAGTARGYDPDGKFVGAKLAFTF
ncbi:MAG: hypothetical protein KKC14_17925 [Alphaproteobacteria bacterium]|nr:hypothetical protein [Alphaproteobacteria bacterium]